MAGTFNQSLQCTQDVFIGFQAPSPPVGSAASGDDSEDRGGDEVNVDAGESTEVTRRDSPMPREVGLIAEMEREAMEAGLGGWFNGNLEDVPESWTWRVVQRESGGRPGELEWCQLRRVGQSGSSWNNSPDNYWRPNLA